MRIFFHVFNGSEMVFDPEGDEFPDWDAAVAEAMQTARDLAAERLRIGNPFPPGWAVHAADGHGALLKVISLAQLVDVEGFAPISGKPRKVSNFAALCASAEATAARSRSIHSEIKATVADIRAQLRSLATWNSG
jgi:hypothetical protein